MKLQTLKTITDYFCRIVKNENLINARKIMAKRVDYIGILRMRNNEVGWILF